MTLILAQNGQTGAPALPGADGAPTTAQPAAPGNGATGGNGGGAGGGGETMLFLIMIIVAVLIITSLLGTRRDKKRREAMLASLTKNARVQTVGGIIGSVVEVKGELVTLKVDESNNTRLTVARSAVQQVLSEHSNAGAASAD